MAVIECIMVTLMNIRVLLLITLITMAVIERIIVTLMNIRNFNE